MPRWTFSANPGRKIWTASPRWRCECGRRRWRNSSANSIFSVRESCSAECSERIGSAARSSRTPRHDKRRSRPYDEEKKAAFSNRGLQRRAYCERMRTAWRTADRILFLGMNAIALHLRAPLRMRSPSICNPGDRMPAGGISQTSIDGGRQDRLGPLCVNSANFAVLLSPTIKTRLKQGMQ